LDLVELDDLSNPSFVGDEVSFSADGHDVFFQLVEVDGDVVDSREDIGEKAGSVERERSEEPRFAQRLKGAHLVRRGTSSATSLGTIVSVTD
jgi:hypothetical protein